MAERGSLPPKLYFRIGEVATLVGVEPHVLRYWEREFRSIRPTKSAKGQRVYSRRDVENLMRVRELLYAEGFTIAGEDRKFVNARAEIRSDTVVVSSPQVPHPVAVRYGWANNPPARLYNGAGLPAAPFRTAVH